MSLFYGQLYAAHRGTWSSSTRKECFLTEERKVALRGIAALQPINGEYSYQKAHNKPSFECQ